MVILIGLIAALVIMALLARYLEESWLSPGAFFSLLWCCYSFTIWFFDMPANVLAGGLLWVLLSSVLVHVGCILGRGRIPKPTRGIVDVNGLKSTAVPYLKTLTFSFSMIGLTYALTVFFRSGSSLLEVMSFGHLNQLVMFNRATFIYGPEKLEFEELVAFAFFYSAPLFGGVLFGLENGLWARIISLVSVVAPSTVGLLYGSRMGALFGGSFWISSYMASQVLTRARFGNSSGNALAKALIASGLFILGVPGIVIFIRYEEGQFGTVGAFLETAGDILSFLPSFSVSLQEEGFKFFSLMYGKITFGRLFEIITFRFGDHFAYDAIDVGYTSSNVFTIFRGLIDDFGHMGALLATLLFGVMAGVSYAKVHSGRLSFLPLLVTAYAGVFTSFSFSLFSYTTPTLGLFLFWLYMMVMAGSPRLQGARAAEKSARART